MNEFTKIFQSMNRFSTLSLNVVFFSHKTFRRRGTTKYFPVISQHIVGVFVGNDVEGYGVVLLINVHFSYFNYFWWKQEIFSFGRFRGNMCITRNLTGYFKCGAKFFACIDKWTFLMCNNEKRVMQFAVARWLIQYTAHRRGDWWGVQKRKRGGWEGFYSLDLKLK